MTGSGAAAGAATRAADYLAQAGVVPVVVVSSADQALHLADALAAGGLTGMEVTFRSAAAAAAIRAVTDARPGFVVGAGTLLTTASVDAAVEAGAHFGVAPGTNPEVLAHAASRGLDFIPGAATASELDRALALGADVVKLFPAEAAGGVALIDALAGPYPHARLMPTGGIRVDDLPRYLSRPSVLACGGTWIAPRDLLEAGDFAEITRRAASAADTVRTIRDNARKEHHHGA
ncbi:bifunctional 4-hydroxy-2-oxoglutarate aldolase/2-dehydro-3-deoxy-phosphogluconate aldolase [Herbiconiux moechotypicola]|uniref:2-dehydro-3-deoxy-phosphogluconate aldolase n=1 Tax=Herbiconiux moechotypicola TaxID=637393 RepID=A0ABN3DZZ8_9MICO|nr:bifunctional 4-hydroxy-2-oxoglutarate aldolase/2-dehydro-3-deoxy-phosphogluconate aldolase [Herbiconiux moechotypicola]MCS5731188.1 bifunctional 4-hydroxy-2-oxoglutarate aldolase/2-dehydro-3-deoxy-phosphogluconate aldolase [Herbiconiux moechotypicola]